MKILEILELEKTISENNDKLATLNQKRVNFEKTIEVIRKVYESLDDKFFYKNSKSKPKKISKLKNSFKKKVGIINDLGFNNLITLEGLNDSCYTEIKLKINKYKKSLKNVIRSLEEENQKIQIDCNNITVEIENKIIDLDEKINLDETNEQFSQTLSTDCNNNNPWPPEIKYQPIEIKALLKI